MSIDSIGPTINTQTVSAPDAAARATDNAHKVEDQQPIKQERQELSEDQKQQAVDGFYSGTGMSTQDFMVLRTQVSEEPFEALDKVIAKMKENMEEVGDAIEAMSEMVKKTSKDNIALQVLQKTLEAMDESSGTERQFFAHPYNSILLALACIYIMRMKIGDVVLPKKDHAMMGIDYGYGVVVDFYESDDGIPYYEVAWPGADRTWWADVELELVSESR